MRRVPPAQDHGPTDADDATTRTLCVGVGCTRGAEPAGLAATAEALLAESGLAPDAVRVVATARRKQGEPALRLWADAIGAAFMAFDDAALAAQPVVTRSERLRQTIGLASVAEAAALAAAGVTDLLVTRRKAALPGGHYMTFAVAAVGPKAGGSQ